MSRVDDTVFLQPDEHAGMIRGAPRLERVGRPIERHRRHCDGGLLRQTVLKWLQRMVASVQAERATVAMNDDIHEVGIVESGRRSIEDWLFELPAGRRHCHGNRVWRAARSCARMEE